MLKKANYYHWKKSRKDSKRRKRSKVPWEKKWPRYIIARARQVWRWSPARREVLKNAKELQMERFSCASCKKGFSKKGVVVDHIIPVIFPRQGWEGWDKFFSNLLNVSAKDLQVLCKECHKVKTQEENKIRRQYAKDKVC